MNIREIVENIAFEAGRPELSDDPANINMVLRWLDRYKLYLQRDKRICFSENTSIIVLNQNNRNTPLPSDFLFPITIRRPKAGMVATTHDIHGNQFQYIKSLTFQRWLDRESFLDHFPTQRDDGELNTGATNDYIIQGRNIVWGRIPSEDEAVFIDYFRILPPYHYLDNPEDDFSIYYHDGLFYEGMRRIFDTWIPDEKKADKWLKERLTAESGLRKYQVGREIPMESQLEMQDT